MRTHHFRRKFYAPNIIFPCIYVNTQRNFDFLRIKIWSQKIPPPPKPECHGKIVQYFQNIFILLGTLNVRVLFKHKNIVVKYALF